MSYEGLKFNPDNDALTPDRPRFSLPPQSTTPEPEKKKSCFFGKCEGEVEKTIGTESACKVHAHMLDNHV